eukprot:scaffold217969_cov24-Tisochrysis_lutea.AAC.5
MCCCRHRQPTPFRQVQPCSLALCRPASLNATARESILLLASFGALCGACAMGALDERCLAIALMAPLGRVPKLKTISYRTRRRATESKP